MRDDAATKRLFAALEEALRTWMNDPHSGRLKALQAIAVYLFEQGFPGVHLFLVLDCIEKTMQERLGGAQKPIREAVMLAQAAAAISLCKGKDAYGSLDQSASKVARAFGGKWTAQELKNHRNNLMSGRASPLARGWYENFVRKYEGRDDLSAKQKADQMLKVIRALREVKYFE